MRYYGWVKPPFRAPNKVTIAEDKSSVYLLEPTGELIELPFGDDEEEEIELGIVKNATDFDNAIFTATFGMLLHCSFVASLILIKIHI